MHSNLERCGAGLRELSLIPDKRRDKRFIFAIHGRHFGSTRTFSFAKFQNETKVLRCCGLQSGICRVSRSSLWRFEIGTYHQYEYRLRAWAVSRVDRSRLTSMSFAEKFWAVSLSSWVIRGMLFLFSVLRKPNQLFGPCEGCLAYTRRILPKKLKMAGRDNLIVGHSCEFWEKRRNLYRASSHSLRVYNALKPFSFERLS